MARRRAQPRVDQSQFSARDVSDDFRSRDTSDELDPMYEETPSGSAEEVDADPMGARGPSKPPVTLGRLMSLPPQVRAMFTFIARLASSLSQGTVPDMRPVPPEQRSSGIVLVVQILPDGRRVVFR